MVYEFQDQKTPGSDFEYMGPAEIPDSYVSWPKDTEFPWSAHHQTVDEVHSLSVSGQLLEADYMSVQSQNVKDDTVYLYTANLQNESQNVLVGRRPEREPAARGPQSGQGYYDSECPDLRLTQYPLLKPYCCPYPVAPARAKYSPCGRQASAPTCK